MPGLAAAEAGPEDGTGGDVAEHRREAAGVIFIRVGEDDRLETARPARVQIGNDTGQAGVGAAEAPGAGVDEEPAAAGCAERDGVALADVDRDDLQRPAPREGDGRLP